MKDFLHIERFHSRDQWARFLTKTKENVCIRIEFNSRTISWEHQYGCRSFVQGHQHGRRDVTWKRSIRIRCSRDIIAYLHTREVSLQQIFGAWTRTFSTPGALQIRPLDSLKYVKWLWLATECKLSSEAVRPGISFKTNYNFSLQRVNEWSRSSSMLSLQTAGCEVRRLCVTRGVVNRLIH